MSSGETLDMSGFGNLEDVKSYSRPAKGWYHVIVSAIDDSREKVGGIKLEGRVLNGTVEDQKGKTWDEVLWDPNPDHKDGGKFALQRQVSFALAVGLVQPAQCGQQPVINWGQATARQFVCKLIHNEKESKGRTYHGAEVEGTEFYPVNHADVVQVPKDSVALGMLGQAGAVAAPAAPQQPTQPPQPPQQVTGQQAPPAATGAAGSKPFDYSNF